MLDKRLIFRLDEATENRMKMRCTQLGISYAVYIRELINKELLTEHLEVFYGFISKLDKVENELNRIGVNLNQVAMYLNKSKGKKVADDTEEKIVIFCEEITDILEELGEVKGGIKVANNIQNRRVQTENES
ncbi:plasmid mobilization relaxosome protein MobC [Fusobacterium polymorphum]|uniref:plasmid mobilization relaxosome protein MobC n=1 Tax=Fusobacterium nucleatum subsp. polymorphum TaxID=76857 RepID=UPI00300B6C7B